MGPLYALADAIYRFMESGPAMPLDFLYIAVAAIPVTLLHELGHAFAARRLLGTDVEVSVGSAGQIAQVRLGKVSATINAFIHPGRAEGAAVFDNSRATAHDILLIAIAGPLASLAGLVLAAALLSAAPATGIVHDFLWAAVGCGVFGVFNLVPFEFQERRNGPALRTDGRLALDALRVARALRASSGAGTTRQLAEPSRGSNETGAPNGRARSVTSTISATSMYGSQSGRWVQHSTIPPPSPPPSSE